MSLANDMTATPSLSSSWRAADRPASAMTSASAGPKASGPTPDRRPSAARTRYRRSSTSERPPCRIGPPGAPSRGRKEIGRRPTNLWMG